MAKRKTRDFVPRYEALIWRLQSDGAESVRDELYAIEEEILDVTSFACLCRVQLAAEARYERKRAKGRTGP